MNLIEMIDEYETRIKMIKLFSSYLVNGVNDSLLVERRDGTLDKVSLFIDDDCYVWRSENLYYEIDGRNFTSSEWDIIKVVDKDELN